MRYRRNSTETIKTIFKNYSSTIHLITIISNYFGALLAIKIQDISILYENKGKNTILFQNMLKQVIINVSKQSQYRISYS
jgi:hypothetical protein